MNLSRSALELVLASNVAELRFKRRIRKPGYNDYRRMLCTKDQLLLLSPAGRTILNYQPPTSALKYDPSQKNLVVAWDIFLQNWRMINCDQVDVISVIQSTPQENWWKYFEESIRPMSANEKALFNNT